jgi:hypothetical protein
LRPSKMPFSMVAVAPVTFVGLIPLGGIALYQRL